MKLSMIKGLGFGLTSAVITTLGMIVGLNATTHSELIIIGGVLTIAIADSLSDALGIHISEEAENKHTAKEIWESTIATFLSKFIFALSFVVPFIFFSLSLAIIISVIYGLLLIIFFSIYISKQQGDKLYKPVFEHLVIAVIVIVITHYVGNWIGNS